MNYLSGSRRVGRTERRWLRWRGTSWAVRRLGEYPNWTVGVERDGRIAITCYPAQLDVGTAFLLTRTQARTLAARLADCLEATA